MSQVVIDSSYLRLALTLSLHVRQDCGRQVSISGDAGLVSYENCILSIQLAGI